MLNGINSLESRLINMQTINPKATSRIITKVLQVISQQRKKWNNKVLNPKEGRKRKKGTMNRWNTEQMEQTENSKMIDLNLIISIITLNVNDLKILIKGQRLSDWIESMT